MGRILFIRMAGIEKQDSQQKIYIRKFINRGRIYVRKADINRQMDGSKHIQRKKELMKIWG